MPTLSRNILISVVLAIAAGGAILAYTSQVKSSADSSEMTVPVVVATHEIVVGTPIDDAQAKGWLEVRPVRETEVSDSAVRSFASVGGQIVTQTLYDGDQLTAFRVGTQESQTAAGQVTGGFRAVRVPFNVNSGLLNDLRADDHVDVLTSYRRGDTTFTYLAVPNAQVLSVSAPAQGGGNFSAPGSGGSLLLQVTEQQALIIAGALAGSSGTSNNIWLAAVGRSGATYGPIDPIELPGELPNHGIPAK
jgi:Flp pilus assembly protein CpaB